jgi:protein-S-isoprenylcysteine O-methyltransferase Ste14
MRTAAVAIAIPVVMVALFFFVPVLRGQPWTALRIAGAVIAVAGFALAITARVQLGQSFAFTPQAKGLVTHGLYSRIRNPMYVCVDVALFGLILAINLPWLLGVVLLMAMAQARQAGREAKTLREKFGQAYLDYRKTTWF